MGPSKPRHHAAEEEGRQEEGYRQEEGFRRRWQGQEEEVVKGQGQGKGHERCVLRQGAYEKCVNEVPKFKLITPSVISERMRVNGSLARRTIKDLMAKGLIRQVSSHSSQCIYTRSTNT